MTNATLETLTTFGELLRYLRRRARLTQRELGAAVGYSEAHIGRLENNERRPEVATVSTRFVEALDLKHEPQLASRLISLASATHSQFFAAPEDADGIVRLRRSNLPAPLSSFVGREREIAEVRELLSAHRLVTLTGSGGVGKTRLAREVARQMTNLGNEPDIFRDGVCWVELAALADPALVPHSVVTALGVSEGTGLPILDVLTRFLRDKSLLLALDNCEHLIEACARLADALLRACPRLTILATSRERLGVDGETVYRVPSLAFPDGQHASASEADHLLRFEAVRLFVERAGAATSGFKMTAQDTQAVAQICRRLDGIPLAIELAAARTHILPVEQIAARLDDRFKLLTGGSRAALPRQQTLRGMIDWSYALLSEAEQALLRQLAVFAGGWTLEAAEELRIENSELRSGSPSAFLNSEFSILNLLAQLVDKSLVMVERTNAGETRYRLLETIRQYASDRLVECGEDVATRDRHLDYFVGLAERAEPELRAVDQVAWLDRLESELDNIRAALGWALEAEDERHVEAGLRLATAPMWLWHIREYKREGAEWLERLLAAEARMAGAETRSHKRALIRARALNAAGLMRHMQGNNSKCHALAQESRSLLRALSDLDKRTLAFALWLLAGSVESLQDADRARALSEESLALYREAGDKFGMSECLMWLGGIALGTDVERARSIYFEGLALREEIGDKDGIANMYLQLGFVAFSQGDLELAAAMYEESLAGFKAVGNKSRVGNVLSELGRVALAKGAYEQADGQFARAFMLADDAGNKVSIAFLHWQRGMAAQAQGDYEQAAIHFEKELALLRELNRPVEMTAALCNLGRVALTQGNHEQAALRFEEAFSTVREADDNFVIACALFGRGCMAQARGDFAAAHALHTQALALRRGLFDRYLVAESLDAIAVLAVAQSHYQRAVRLFSASTAQYELIRFTQSLYERDMHEHALTEARAQLGEEAFTAAWAEGKAMTLDEAVELALASMDKSG